MSINILFPEFILSKAICDLRQALDELRQFDENLPEVRDRVTHITRKEYKDHVEVFQRPWYVEYPPCYKMLYRLLRLEIPGSGTVIPPSKHEMEEPNPSRIHQDFQPRFSSRRYSTGSIPNDTTRSFPPACPESPGNKKFTTESPVQKSPQSRNQNTTSPPAPPAIRVLVHNSPRKWTAVHSYYAQMGGILTIPAWDRWFEFDLDLFVTSTKLTSQYEWDDSSEHPLKHLRLSREDIEDKSKADSMLKCLAIFQIMWLVLNATVRAATGLHVTQLEIATVAFATVAILTYLASWWKPKDVSEATEILHPCSGRWIHQADVVTLSQWFRFLGSKDDLAYERPRRSVPNDLIFEASSMAFLLSISSLLFGGLHCVAWNFEFPSQAELVAWRIGCATIAVLPAIALAFSTLLASILSSRHARYMHAAEELDLHRCPSPESLPTAVIDWMMKQERSMPTIRRAARYISTISYIFYPAARLLTIVLLFTSLRSLPADVYQVDPWVNFLPKIS